MSYLVFARKWRPLAFEDVVGQGHITETLKKAIEKNRVAHAYIFTGTRGVGKTTTARILARALNCEKGPTPAPCGECTACKDIINGTSFDVLEIDGASNNSVNDIRELRENIGYSSMGGKHRIYVIDEVHMLSNSAFNALLKTLEEPPKNVIFIFATTEPQKIPATIHSRCQRYDFRRIGTDHILERLIYICDTEKIAYERTALMLVAQKADGSMRDALSLLDQVYSFCHDNLNEKEVRSVLGLVGGDVYTKIIDCIAGKDAATILGLVQEVLYQGFDLQEFLIGLQEHLRNLLFARIPGALATRGIDLDTECAEAFARSATRFTEGDLLRMAEIVRKTEHDLKWNVFSRFSVEIMMLKLVFLDSTLSIERMIKLFGGGDTALPASVSSTEGEQEQKKKLNPPAGAFPGANTRMNSRSSPNIPCEPAAVPFAVEEPNAAQPVLLTGAKHARNTAGYRPGAENIRYQTAGEMGVVESLYIGNVADGGDMAESGAPEYLAGGDPELSATTGVHNPAESHGESPLQTEWTISREPAITGGFTDVHAAGAEGQPDLQHAWPAFIEMLLRDRPKLGSFLSLAMFAGCTSHTIDLRFPPTCNFQFQELNKNHHRDEITHLLRSFTQQPYEVRMTISADAADTTNSYFTSAGIVPLTINDEIEHEPIIQTVLDMFDGEIIE